MILELKVTSFATIDSLQVRFLRPGLNVLTGETGAGKSILLKALSLLLGGKAAPDTIRSGCEHAVIEGAFDLSGRPDLKSQIEELALASGDDALVVRRIIQQAGKSRIYINGHLSTLNVLEKVTSQLLEITGQHEHHSLIKPTAQLDLLDEAGELQPLRQKYSNVFATVQDLRKQIAELSEATRSREQRLDFLKFQISEIENFNPAPGEDEDLDRRHQRARSAGRLLGFSEKAEGQLYGEEKSVHEILTELLRDGEKLTELDPALKPNVQSLKDAAVLIEEAAYGFRDYAKKAGGAEEDLDKLEERLSDLKKLQKKYGANVTAMLEFKKQAEVEVERLEKSDESLKTLETDLKKQEAELGALADQLSLKRKTASKKFATRVNQELVDLNMKGAELIIEVRKLENLSSSGADEVLFMIKNSPKDEPRPISRVASGGELSRIMLAIKQVIVSHGWPMTYLFDEVDTGVSGPTAEKVGKKLKSIARAHQVICITHLPQVAAFGDAHFLISKDVKKGLVHSEVTELSNEERVKELGRLISGEKVTASSLTHAREMLKSSRTI